MKISLEDFSSVVASIHEAPVVEGGWAAAIAGAVRLLGATKGAIFDVIRPTNALCGVVTTGHDPAATREYQEYYYAIDPTFEVALVAAPHQAHTVLEVFPTEFRVRSEYFAFANRIDIGDALGVNTHADNDKLSVLTLQRPVGAAGFDAQARRLAGLLTPHLERAKRVESRLAEAAGAASALAAGLDRLVHAAFILDGDGLIRHMNAAAQALLKSDSRLRTAQGRLRLAAPGLNGLLGAALAGAAREGGTSTLLALPASGRHAAGEMAVVPLRASHEAARHWQRPLALAVVPATRRDPEQIARRMRRLYGLTDAESRVVTLLAQGYSMNEIAFARGVRDVTLRGQLKSIFAKAGVTRQADLVRCALGGAPLAPDP